MRKLLATLFVTIFSLSLLTCCESEDKSTYRIEIGDKSTNFKSNYYLQIAVSGFCSEYNNEALSELRTEKEAISWFNNACNDIKQKTDAMSLPVLDESWVVLELRSIQNTSVYSKQIEFSK